VELDPVEWYGTAGTHYLYAGQYEKIAGRCEKAVRYLNAAVELHPDASFYLGNLGLAYVTIGRVEEGLTMVKRASGMAGGPRSYGDLAWAYVKAERPEDAKNLLTVLDAEERKRTTVIAGVYAVLGEKERAIDWLERAYDERSGYLAAIECDFVYENLRDEPRYQALLEKLGIKKPM
jgi:tetratricopeptide (TPR) repeat protein